MSGGGILGGDFLTSGGDEKVGSGGLCLGGEKLMCQGGVEICQGGGILGGVKNWRKVRRKVSRDEGRLPVLVMKRVS